jgi:hypothetical protein
MRASKPAPDIPHRPQVAVILSQLEKRKYLPSAVQIPEDCRDGGFPAARIGCELFPSADTSQIDCVPYSLTSTVNRMVRLSGDHAGA